jgi:hypothetical protein
MVVTIDRDIVLSMLSSQVQYSITQHPWTNARPVTRTAARIGARRGSSEAATTEGAEAMTGGTAAGLDRTAVGPDRTAAGPDTGLGIDMTTAVPDMGPGIGVTTSGTAAREGGRSGGPVSLRARRLGNRRSHPGGCPRSRWVLIRYVQNKLDVSTIEEAGYQHNKQV